MKGCLTVALVLSFLMLIGSVSHYYTGDGEFLATFPWFIWFLIFCIIYVVWDDYPDHDD